MSRFGVSSDSNNNDTWILGFKDGVTRIRIVQELPWVKYTQHFSTTAFYFPHLRTEPDKCVGCLYPEFFNDKGEPKQQVQYAFNAFDEEGKLRIFRLGIDAFKILKSRSDRIGTLTDRDHNIVRSGKGLNTTYIPEPGDKYEVDMPEEMLDIYAALDAKYDEAEKKILAKVEEEGIKPWKPGDDTDEAQAAMSSKPKTEPRASTPPAKVEEKKEPTKNEVDFEDMSTPDIKAWLEERKVEMKPRPSRADLIKLAEANRETPNF